MTASPLFGDQNVKPWLEIMGCPLSFPIWNGKFILKKIHMVKENILLFKHGDESQEEYIPTSKESAETGE